MLCLLLATLLAVQPTTRPRGPDAADPDNYKGETATSRPTFPITLERVSYPGPAAGVLATVDLTDPRVSVLTLPAHPEDPDGDGPMITRLDTVRNVAERLDLELAVNASFFAAPQIREHAGRPIRFYYGNAAAPVSWLVHEGEVLTSPSGAQADWPAIIVDDEGTVSIASRGSDRPDNIREAVAGNVQLLEDGQPVPHDDPARHPRTAVGVSEDGRTLWILCIDGRTDDSRGMSFAELSDAFAALGAYDALNLDGGGSSTMVVEDPGTGAFAIANRPSDRSFALEGTPIERPVADVLGIDVAE